MVNAFTYPIRRGFSSGYRLVSSIHAAAHSVGLKHSSIKIVSRSGRALRSQPMK